MEHIQAQQAPPMQCPDHGYDIIYMQVNELTESKKIFYCEVCVSLDFDFKTSNYIRLKQIQQAQAEKAILNFWPPLNNTQIQKQLIGLNNNQTKSNEESIQGQIVSFFDDLKQQILLKLDECQKNAITQSEHMILQKEKIKEKYNEISQLEKLQSFVKNSTTSLSEKETLCKEFIAQIKEQQTDYSKSFEDMFKEQKMKSTETMNEIKQKVIGCFDQISFFTFEKPNEVVVHSDYIKDLEFVVQPLFHDFNTISITKNLELGQIIFQNDFDVDGQYGCKFYYSTTPFQKNKTYVFTLKMESMIDAIQTGVQFGFVNEATKDKQENDDMFRCLLYVKDNKTTLTNTKGISKVVKGDFKNLASKETQIQLTLHASEGIMEITDLPEQKHKATLIDAKISLLKKLEQLRFYISILDDIEVTITSIKEL